MHIHKQFINKVLLKANRFAPNQQFSVSSISFNDDNFTSTMVLPYAPPSPKYRQILKLVFGLTHTDVSECESKTQHFRNLLERFSLEHLDEALKNLTLSYAGNETRHSIMSTTLRRLIRAKRNPTTTPESPTPQAKPASEEEEESDVDFGPPSPPRHPGPPRESPGPSRRTRREERPSSSRSQQRDHDIPSFNQRDRSSQGSSKGNQPRRCQGCRMMGCSPLKRTCEFHFSRVHGLRDRVATLQTQNDNLQRLLRDINGKINKELNEGW
jgi:hypothetical protein